MKKSLLTLTFALVALFAAAQPPQGQPPQPNANRDSLSPRAILGPLFKRIQVHGYLQAGYEFNNKLGENSNEFNFKRSNIVAFAQITDRWYFFFLHDFNSEVQEFYTDFRITKGKGLNIRFGQMKNSFGLENPYSPAQFSRLKALGLERVKSKEAAFHVLLTLYSNAPYFTNLRCRWRGTSVSVSPNAKYSESSSCTTGEPLKFSL